MAPTRMRIWVGLFEGVEVGWWLVMGLIEVEVEVEVEVEFG